MEDLFQVFDPAPPTAEYLDFVLTRLTAIGATYLAAVCILPEILISQSTQFPFTLEEQVYLL